MKRFVHFSLVLMFLGSIGCGASSDSNLDLVSVKGTLYLDGQTHGPAQLILTPVQVDENDKRPPVGGDVAADGSFTLTTYETGDGAPPGEYEVTIGGGSDIGSTDPAAMMASVAGTSTQKTIVEIPAGGSESLEIKLTSAEKKKGTSAADKSNLLGN